MDIAIGVIIGIVVGVINGLVLRYGVRLAVKCAQRAKATLIVIASYAIRYILIAAVVYAILKKGNLTIAITTLAVVGLFTILWAVFQRARNPAEERGS